MDYSEILENALKWGQEKHPESNQHRHAAFANSVAYLVTGASGGYGGPSIREHAVSWSLAGDGAVAGGLLFPDGRVPRAGTWEFKKACAFAEPIVYGKLPAIARRIADEEHCFDDDPADLEELRGKA